MSAFQIHQVKIGLGTACQQEKNVAGKILDVLKKMEAFDNDRWEFSFNGNEQKVPEPAEIENREFNVFECCFSNHANFFFGRAVSEIFMELDEIGGSAYAIWFEGGDHGAFCRTYGCAKKEQVETVPASVNWKSEQDFAFYLTMAKEEWGKMLNCSNDLDDIEQHFYDAEEDPIYTIFGKEFADHNLGGCNLTVEDVTEKDGDITFFMWSDFASIVENNSLDEFVRHFHEAAEIMKQRNHGEIYMSIYTERPDVDGNISCVVSDKDFYAAEFESEGNKITNLKYFHYTV